MSSLHPKTVPSVTPFFSPPTIEAQLAAFRSEVEQIRASIDGELVFHPGRPKPCRVGGVMCHTSARVIAAYVPSSAHPCTQSEWRQISELVRDCVRLSISASPSTTLARMQTTAAFVAWCLRSDVPLHAETMFTPPRVEQYVATQMAHRNPRGQASVRTELRCVGRACTTRAGWDRPAPRLDTGPRVGAPYTPDEVSGLWSAALAQSTTRRRHVLATVLTLGLGAGLSNTEMFELRTSQVLEHPVHDGVLVLALLDRLVPVRHDVKDTLLHLCDAQPSGRLIGGRAEKVLSRNQILTMIAHLDVPTSLPPVTVRRLRTTWAVDCLRAGVNPAEFCRMAGISARSGSSLTHYLPYVPLRDHGDAWMLAAAGPPANGALIERKGA